MIRSEGTREAGPAANCFFTALDCKWEQSSVIAVYARLDNQPGEKRLRRPWKPLYPPGRILFSE